MIWSLHEMVKPCLMNLSNLRRWSFLWVIWKGWYFLGVKVKKDNNEIFIHQQKYAKDVL